MLGIFSGLSIWVGFGLVMALAFVLVYEFINGFHDTANAVATVIYTKAMPPKLAVILSGVFNFLGVLTGGVGIAYSIVHLLPVELLLNVNSSRGLVMIFSMVSAAIIWNLGTWFFGIPASSSHTLIGSILGVGLANAWETNISIQEGVNWSKAIDVGLSMVISPIVGFILAGWLFFMLKSLRPNSNMHYTPKQRRALEAKKHPPFWNRLALVISAMGVSFAHGSNDGQKGIGLVMLILIGIVPTNYVLNLNSTSYQIDRTRNAAIHLNDYYHRNHTYISNYLDMENQIKKEDLTAELTCDPRMTKITIDEIEKTLKNLSKYENLSTKQRTETRRNLLCLDDIAKNVVKTQNLPTSEIEDLERLRADLTATIEYAPLWVVIAVAMSLGCGTMIGWKRVVMTVGEKIGTQGMTYAQGTAAQVTAVFAIGMANLLNLPVSTTHVLSSGIAGTIVANKVELQKNTVRQILLAWILTLPAALSLSAVLFLSGMSIIEKLN
ncbi:PiT family inorganic phosphate transporter [Candidatus Kinetoplastibacterium desouzaii TCC079E]|uniref:Phosphate transporter n=1 Tax=Candidatus Kinetoplastidibacterium desouzai TCC079E TaxID=1208919 RepID=M1LTQ4_9PROT|nr:inorganic phosphate transporter [Candidatus Kinetoplastibacterium desouzaii]AGF46684.1 PiT family inorganic phosphate transporter [Candidatus Kinetoplastibacterium desouzaii TCC079E]